MTATPQTTKQWTVIGKNWPDSLDFSESDIPELSDNEVLVKIHGASINFRDVLIAQGSYPFALIPNVIPGSDGAGVVIATGKRVSRFKQGDKVVTIINQKQTAGLLTQESLASGLGGALHGTLREFGAFDEQGLVKMPEGISFIEAASLSCAGLTAWNALYGLSGRPLMPGQWVLTQGTGGVSIFALQFAKATGAKVIATTSSNEKAKLLEQLGADHIINYRDDVEWGSTALELTGGVGVDIVVEVGGPKTLHQSIKSVKLEGIIALVGFIGGAEGDMPSLLTCWTEQFIGRGIGCGTRAQMEEMCRAIEANPEKLRPVIDQKVFSLRELKEAYEYLNQGKHQGKVGIRVA